MNECVYIIFCGIGKTTLTESKPEKFITPKLFTIPNTKDKRKVYIQQVKELFNTSEKKILLSCNKNNFIYCNEFNIPVKVILPTKDFLSTIRKHIQNRPFNLDKEKEILIGNNLLDYWTQSVDLANMYNFPIIWISSDSYILEELL